MSYFEKFSNTLSYSYLRIHFNTFLYDLIVLMQKYANIWIISCMTCVYFSGPLVECRTYSSFFKDPETWNFLFWTFFRIPTVLTFIPIFFLVRGPSLAEAVCSWLTKVILFVVTLIQHNFTLVSKKLVHFQAFIDRVPYFHQ